MAGRLSRETGQDTLWRQGVGCVLPGRWRNRAKYCQARRKGGSPALAFSCLWLLLALQAEAKGTEYPLQYGEAPENGAVALELTEAAGEYTVADGDCLWTIAEKLWGDGGRYSELALANRETVKNPDLIYPGMVLQTAQKGYLVRTDAGRGGIGMGEYAMDMPSGWTVGYLESGEAFANFAMSGEGKIACLIRDKEAGTVRSVEDWEACAERIRQYAEENYKDSVQDLKFEHYRMKGQEEVYLYSYVYEMDMQEYGMEGSYGWNICVGMKLTGHIQAEFVGTSLANYDIHGSVRYVTASFEEHYKEGDEGAFTVNDSNMAISPAVEWELSGMFNPFPWAEEYFDALARRAIGTKQGSAGEKQIKK